MADQPITWSITGQREDFGLGPAGTYVMGVVVSFRTPSGAVGSVFVPSDAYSVERVREAVGAKATTMEAVAGLTGA